MVVGSRKPWVFGVWMLSSGALLALTASPACSREHSLCDDASCGAVAGGAGGESADAAGGSAPDSAAGGTQGGDGALGSGGSNAEGGRPAAAEGGAAGEPSLPDTEPPTILSVSPELGEAGVTSDATIEVTFSEPMDKPSVQAAFQTPNLGDVTFDWPTDDVLRVTPNDPLEYASGSSLALAAKSYGFSITTVAEDLSGNALQNAATSEFTTLRRISALLPRVDTYYEYNDGTVRSLYHPNPGSGGLVGDAYSAQFTNNESVRGLLVFDLSALPIGIEAFESASLTVSLCCTVGNPAALGSLEAFHMHLETIDDGMFDAAPLGSLGTLASSLAPGLKALMVTEAVADDYANREARANRSQVRLQLTSETDDDMASDNVTFDSTAGSAPAPQISTTFLIP